MTEYETRTVTAEVEIRGDESATTIVGHAATFNQPYQVGYFNEQIHPQAFDRTLRRDDSGKLLSDVRLFVDHEGQPLARTKSGTLRLGTDDRGLTVEADLDMANPKVQEVTSALKRGDVDQMSFGFRVPVGGDSWDHMADPPMRMIREANLSGGDVSIVTFPANENTSVHLRSQDRRNADFTYAVAMLTELHEGRSIDRDRFMRVLASLTGDELVAAERSFATNTTALVPGSLLTTFSTGTSTISHTLDVPVDTSQRNATIPPELARRLLDAATLRRNAA